MAEDRLTQLAGIHEEALRRIPLVKSLEELETLRVSLLGKKGSLAALLNTLKDMPGEERPAFGKRANEVKNDIEGALARAEERLERAAEDFRLATESIDITLPGRRRPAGKRHLVTRIIERIEDIFVGMGYEIVEGPEVETDYYNFEGLNTPPWHPARSLADTFWLDGAEDDLLLRTHTSPVQVRTMESRRPPLFVLSPGKAYRRDVPDASHTPMFHQVEGFAVDRGLTMTDLKGTLDRFCRELYGEERKVRFRPHFFPFTEPSAEVDVSCGLCRGQGCRLCKYTGWLEILGAGMIDPNVFGHVGYDPESYTGFAFGMGVERVAALLYGIPDIRMLYENDFRFLAAI
ncbi:MAG: phenylalanine--tRNA ligase subunit alpha [Candidatus Geothermincolia bacterium]